MEGDAYMNPQQTTRNGFTSLYPDTLGGTLGGMGSMFGGLAALGNMGMGIYTGINSVRMGKEALGLARKQFAFEKGLANRNLANQAKQLDEQNDNEFPELLQNAA